MFPYPSAEGLHVGNLFAFTGSDVHGRFRRLQGHDVFEPIGFDAFGIHSENYAIKIGIHPAELIPRNIANFRRQLKPHRRDVRLAARAVHHRSGLLQVDPVALPAAATRRARRTRRRRPVNWCPDARRCWPTSRCIDGFCERHPDPASSSADLEQWFFRITDYAERLLDNLDRLDWSETTTHGAAQLDRPLRGRGDRFRAGRAGGVPSGCSPPGPTRSSAPPSWCWRRSTRWCARSPRRGAAARRRGLPRHVASRDLVARKVGDNEKTGVFTGAYASQSGDRRAASRSGSPTTC